MNTTEKRGTSIRVRDLRIWDNCMDIYIGVMSKDEKTSKLRRWKRWEVNESYRFKPHDFRMECPEFLKDAEVLRVVLHYTGLTIYVTLPT